MGTALVTGAPRLSVCSMISKIFANAVEPAAPFIGETRERCARVDRCSFDDARSRDRVPPSATMFRRGCTRLRLACHRPDGRAGSPIGTQQPDGRAGSPIGTEQPDGTAEATRISACAPARSRSAAMPAAVCGGGAAATHVASTGCCAASPGRDPPAPDAAAATSRATAATAARTGHGARTSAWGVWRKRRSPTASLFAVG
jgi:hypothetical protein